ncbi:glycerophosphodiester phosphodiesterase GDPD1, chloroplastic-like [Hibiscus syriacus]|uniref:glycerophosphodiester phosphodiesterase GDPD1, chloroplastic-like n=1 Tax=Hibiscus syriacus TaxID=106335 RepID=UPI0019236088|nr:glycerophosphodiester phosphodiesterase GDPD1, chloroplastic-like [Hibiscus syriacus]
MKVLKAVHVCDVPNLDQVPENAASALCSSRFRAGVNDEEECKCKIPKFLVMGHRGNGMNMLQSSDPRMKSIKENSLLSFNEAAKFPIHFVEFDVQVTKDDCPVIYHDNFILHEEKDAIVENRVTELTLADFLSYGPQKLPGTEGKPIFRKLKDGRIFEWKVDQDAPLCTLEEAFQNVDRSLGFNVELKFDDLVDYTEEELSRILKAILKAVFENAEGRAVMFSSFQPDAVLLIRKLQSAYPVYFLTNGGTEIYTDVRRNSLDDAIKLCVDNGLQGIVSEFRAVFRNPGAVARIKESKLSLITYGQLNNVPEVVYMQYLMGIDGVIVDLVKEISESVSDVTQVEEEEKSSYGEDGKIEAKAKPQFSVEELSFRMKVIPELMIQP